MAPGYVWPMQPAHHPHNPMLEVWVDLGIPGVLLVIAVLIGLVRATWRLEAGVASYAFGCLVAVLAVEGVSHGAWRTWWMLLPMLIVVLFAWADEIRRNRVEQG